MASGAFGSESDCPLDYFHARTGCDESEVVHHLIAVVEEQFHFFSRLNVQGDWIVFQAWLDPKVKLGSRCGAAGQAKGACPKQESGSTSRLMRFATWVPLELPHNSRIIKFRYHTLPP